MEGSVGSAPEGGEKFYFGFLSGNALKILACLLMLTDHIGMILFPEVSALRAVGRLSMPIFAFMFAEGCHYTRHKIRHFALVFALGLVTSAGISLVNERAEGNILITFSLSCLIIYSLAMLKGAAFAHRPKAVAASSAALALSLGASVYLCCFSPVHIEYGLRAYFFPSRCGFWILNRTARADCLPNFTLPQLSFCCFLWDWWRSRRRSAAVRLTASLQ